MNPTRLAFIRSTLCRHFGKDPCCSRPFEGLKFVDVGCGGGILSEPLARMGGSVTGVDAVEKNIKIAQLHVDLDPTTSSIGYLCTTAGIEHVADPADFCKSLSALTKSGGATLISTINRSMRAYATAIIVAEYVLRWTVLSIEAVINRLTLSPVEAEASSSLLQWQNARRCDDERRKCEEAMKMLEMEKMREKKGGGFWWEEAYEGLELHELEEFASALEDLGERVEERLKEFSNSQCAPQDFCSDLVPYGGLSTDWDCLDVSDLIIDSSSSDLVPYGGLSTDWIVYMSLTSS